MPKITGNIITERESFHGTISWENDKICEITKTGPTLPDDQIVLAGFIDVHLHGLGPYSSENIEGCRGMAEFAPSTGTTLLCPTLSCAPTDYLVEMMASIRDLVKAPQNGAVIAGTHMEGPWLNPVHRGGMNRRMLRPPTIAEAQAFLDAAQGTLKLITIAPEMPGAIEVIRLMTANGVTVSAGHTGCPPDWLDEAVAAGVSEICHLFDTFACPVAEEGIRRPALTDMAILNDNVFKEIIMDGLHVPPPLIHLVRRAAGPEHIIGITDAMQGAGMKEGHFTDLGVAYTVREGDFARTDDNGAILGSSLSMNQAFHNMTTRFGFSLPEASMCLSANPARTLKMDNLTGRLARGLYADITVIEPDLKTVSACYVRGCRKH
ncbi:MAG: amidohydrolase family protein [Victivallales bacterium]|nr:amidohydrolase family protein [Victivallales bacterium]